MNALQQRYLAELGVAVWQRRGTQTAPDRRAAVAEVAADAPVAPVAPVAEVAAVAAVPDTARWQPLAAEVAACTRCALHTGRTQTVFGVGRRDADLMIIGEAPGAEEDKRGEPFVGRAGQLLNAMLRAIGLSRDAVYIANILKCRPPGNRDPKVEEAASCTPYLDEQIGLVAPRAILALGRISAQWLLQSEMTIGRLRGQVLQYRDTGIPLVVTYHPAYLLRSPQAKRKTWQDLCLIKNLIEPRQ